MLLPVNKLNELWVLEITWYGGSDTLKDSPVTTSRLWITTSKHRCQCITEVARKEYREQEGEGGEENGDFLRWRKKKNVGGGRGEKG